MASDFEQHLDEERDRIMRTLTRPFPSLAIRKRKGGGGKELDYLEGHTVINRLNEATNNNWNFEILGLDTDTITQILRAHVRLEIPGMGKREHIGIQNVAQATKGGEDIIKGSVTDGLKKAATLYGVGIDLYGPDYEKEGELNRIKNYVRKQPYLKNHMSEWIRSELQGEALTEQTISSLRRLYRDLVAQFPMMDDVDAARSE